MDLGYVSASLANLAPFLAYMGVALALTIAFLAIYTLVTPQNEWALMRAGNGTASLSLGGALIGFCLPLANIIAHSHVLIDVTIWGLVALLVQLGIWGAIMLFDRTLPQRIERNEAAAGTFVAAASIAGGILNAACMTY